MNTSIGRTMAVVGTSVAALLALAGPASGELAPLAPPPAVGELDPLVPAGPSADPAPAAPTDLGVASRRAAGAASYVIPFAGSVDIPIDDLASPGTPGGEVTFSACTVATTGGDAVVTVDCSAGTVLQVTGTGGGGFQYPVTVTLGYDVTETIAGVPTGTSSGTVDVQLDPPAAPTAAPDAATVAQGGTVDIPVALILANDQVAAGSASFTCACLVLPASSGSASTGSVSGQQVLRFAASASYAGDAKVPYTVSDEFGQSASSEVVIDVTEVAKGAEAPVAANDELAVRAGASGTVNVLRNDVDVAGGDLKVLSVAEPQHGEVSWTPDGQVTYEADAGASGTDVLLYEVQGTGGARASALLVVQVTGTGGTTTPKTVSNPTAGSLPATAKKAGTTTAAKAGAPLAKTGSSTRQLAGLGLALVAGGIAVLGGRRGTRRTAPEGPSSEVVGG